MSEEFLTAFYKWRETVNYGWPTREECAEWAANWAFCEAAKIARACPNTPVKETIQNQIAEAIELQVFKS